MPLNSKDLLREQLEAISNRQPKARKAKAVQPNKQAGRAFNAKMQMLVNAIKKDINEQIVPMVKSLESQYISDSGDDIVVNGMVIKRDGNIIWHPAKGSGFIAINDAWSDSIMAIFASLIDKWRSPAFMGAAQSVASEFVTAMNAQNSRRFAKSVKPIGVTGIDIFGDSPKLQDLLSASIADNTRLITSIPERYLDNVQSLVMNNMRSGLRPSAIVKQLQDQYGVTKRRAQLIARDQTSKANGELSKQRQLDTGFEYFRWVDSDDIRVRDRHESIANKDVGYGKGVYRWDDPPKNEKGVPITPGSEINCRCIAQPVTSRQVEQNKKNKV